MENPSFIETRNTSGAITSPAESRWTGFLWLLFGLAMASGGAIIAAILTTLYLADSDDFLAGLLYIFTVPAGWIVGFLVAAVTGWVIDRRTRRFGWSRLVLASIGPAVPIPFLVLLVLLTGLG